ncbi:MAG: shikimate dehydrogenase [Chloroflexota bacterium]
MTAEKIFYFIGVTTGQSSVNRLFPIWMEILGRPDVVLQGIDHQINDRPKAYRTTVERIKSDPNAVGGLITTHKLSLSAAAGDLFDHFGRYAELTSEVSCIAKRGDKLWGFAKDAISSGKALRKILGEEYFTHSHGDLFSLGAGGAAVATLLNLMLEEDKGNRPRRFIAADIDTERLAHAEAISKKVIHDIDMSLHHVQSAVENDALMARLPQGSVIINATGMGKDRPGSPISSAALFPRNGVVWEFNYRGERLFYQQALAQSSRQSLTVVDGWEYFLLGWLEVVTEVLQIELTHELFEKIKAASTR